ncbi:MAG TPA: hypothetical protein PLZ86_05765, partial [bacterium]|nr:hypothetical protein [bacterium]
MRSTMTKVGMIAVAVALFLASSPAFAKNPAKGMNPETGECLVTENSWEGVYSGNLSIIAAMKYANATEAKWSKWCQKKVSIDVTGDRLQMTSPLEIIGGGQGFTVEGKDDVVTLDAKPLTGKGHECAITINGNGVILNNLKITNVPDDMKAICVNKLNAELRDVEITDGGSGVVFAEGVIGGDVGMKASIQITGDGFAVDLGGSEGSLSANRIVPMDTEGMETDKHGLILPAEGQDVVKISAPSIDNFINSDSDIGVCLKRTTEITTGEFKGKIRVEGFVQDATGTLNQDIVRLQIYDRNGFRGYVGEYNSKYRVGMAGTKMVGGTAGGKTGSFKFYIDKDANGESEIILFPEDVSHSVGFRSEKIKLVGDSKGGCYEKGLDPILGGEGEGSEGGTYGDLRLMSKQHCRMMRTITEPGETGTELGMQYDTDGDGIPDDLEDVNFNCECDSFETCWYLMDSDLDGTPDGMGKEKGCQEYAFNADGIPNGCASCGDYDPDGDEICNALDSDSDNDGRLDGVEDRNDAVVFTAGTKPIPGVLYEFSRSNLDPLNVNGQAQECDLGVGNLAGVSYPWYSIKRNGSTVVSATKIGNSIPESGVPVEGQSTTTEATVLVCRLQSLAWPQNFNGVYDQ